MDAFLPSDLGAAAALVLFLASFGTSFLTAAFGIGGGAVLLAILASILPPAALIPVHGVVQLGSNTGRMFLLFKHVHWSVFPGFLAGAVIGVAIGGTVALSLSPAMVQIGVGLFILWSLAFRPPGFLKRWSPVAGAVTSFLTMLFGATGPFVAAWIKTLGLGREAHVGTFSALMTLQHLLKSLAFGVLGFAFLPWAFVILGMIVTGFAGTFAGRLVLARTTDARFHRLLTIILVLLALRLIWAGISSAW